MTFKKGFTLIELMMVVAIITILASIALPSYQSLVGETRMKHAQTQMLNIHFQQQNYYLANNKYAESDSIQMPESDYYLFSIEVQDALNFTIKASLMGVFKTGKSCEEFIITSELVRSPAECW